MRTPACRPWDCIFEAAKPIVLLLMPLLGFSCEDDSRCTAPLQSFGCEATFEAERAKDRGVFARAGMCGAYLIVAPISPGGGFCLYDKESDSLVSAEGGSDLKSFCNGTSETIHGGIEVNPWDLCSFDDLDPQ